MLTELINILAWLNSIQTNVKILLYILFSFRAMLSNPVAIRHMWRQGVFSKSYISVERSNKLQFLQHISLDCGKCDDRDILVGHR